MNNVFKIGDRVKWVEGTQISNSSGRGIKVSLSFKTLDGVVVGVEEKSAKVKRGKKEFVIALEDLRHKHQPSPLFEMLVGKKETP